MSITSTKFKLSIEEKYHVPVFWIYQTNAKTLVELLELSDLRYLESLKDMKKYRQDCTHNDKIKDKICAQLGIIDS